LLSASLNDKSLCATSFCMMRAQTSTMSECSQLLTLNYSEVTPVNTVIRMLTMWMNSCGTKLDPYKLEFV